MKCSKTVDKKKTPTVTLFILCSFDFFSDYKTLINSHMEKKMYSGQL